MLLGLVSKCMMQNMCQYVTGEIYIVIYFRCVEGKVESVGHDLVDLRVA